jgi:hypothetical protein
VLHSLSCKDKPISNLVNISSGSPSAPRGAPDMPPCASVRLHLAPCRSSVTVSLTFPISQLRSQQSGLPSSLIGTSEGSTNSKARPSSWPSTLKCFRALAKKISQAVTLSIVSPCHCQHHRPRLICHLLPPSDSTWLLLAPPSPSARHSLFLS